MAKSKSKSFTDGINGLIDSSKQDSPKQRAKPGRKKTVTRQITKSSQEGTKEGETRATFIVSEVNLGKLKDVSFWTRLSIKNVIGDAIAEYLERYEQKNGAIKERNR